MHCLVVEYMIERGILLSRVVVLQFVSFVQSIFMNGNGKECSARRECEVTDVDEVCEDGIIGGGDDDSNELSRCCCFSLVLKNDLTIVAECSDSKRFNLSLV